MAFPLVPLFCQGCLSKWCATPEAIRKRPMCVFCGKHPARTGCLTGLS